MNAASNSEVIAVDPATIADWLENDQAVLVDVRETSEYDQEHIPGALLLPMSSFDPEVFPSVPGKKVVLHCAIGKRSEAAGKMLLAEGHENVIHMTGGLKAWKAAGLEVDEPYVPHPAPEDVIPETTPQSAPALALDEFLSPPPGKVLADEFLIPHGLSAGALADASGLPRETIEGLIEARIPVTAEISIRLARRFSTAADFWLQLQVEHDLEKARHVIGGEFSPGLAPPRLVAG